ncbi:hypothetical protein HDU89_004067 [Geranomyces variabilis]|nr:hypothetical protein HDU89_004067 [Geranomyces variabilis]
MPSRLDHILATVPQEDSQSDVDLGDGVALAGAQAGDTVPLHQGDGRGSDPINSSGGGEGSAAGGGGAAGPPTRHASISILSGARRSVSRYSVIPGDEASQMYSARPGSSRMQSKHSIRDQVKSDFDTWRVHDYQLGAMSIAGFAASLLLATVVQVASGATVKSEGWFNGMHVVIGLLCMAVAHFGNVVTVCATRAYVASALLTDDDGISLSHVKEAVKGSVIAAMRVLIGDRLRLRREKNHQAIGRRANGLVCSAGIGAALAVCMPLLHVFVIIGTTFTRVGSQMSGFHCDMPDYSKTAKVNVSTWIRGFDFLVMEIPTTSFLTVLPGGEAIMAGCHGVQGHDELQSYKVYQTVPGLRFGLDCEDVVPIGNRTYNGGQPSPAGLTDFSIYFKSTPCDGDFCIINVNMLTWGTNASSVDCILSTRSVTISGYATFLRFDDGGRSCVDYNAEPATITDGDNHYQKVWAASVSSLTQANGRWPRSAWAGGLAFELPMLPPFVGAITKSQVELIMTRAIGGFHKLISGSYDSPETTPCEGHGDVGAGTIDIPSISSAVATAFAALAATVAIYMITSERDLQLMLGQRNYRRAISALEDPLRFAALMDRTEASQNFVNLRDKTPEALGKEVARYLVLIGGDADVSGPVGRSVISTVETVDPFADTRSYR